MTTYNKLTIANQRDCEMKAKTKKDGVYTLRGIAYRVRNNQVTHFACEGEVLVPYGNFNVIVGKYQGSHADATKLLRSIEQ